jgi:endonuclease/exonuclease/phosphatase family metal-dependent hydrolase
MRVATFNIHHAEAVNGIIALERTAALLQEVAPDVIALQEVDRNMSRSGTVDQVAVLGELLGMTLYFAPTITSEGSEYGIALAARGDLEARSEILPRLRGEEPRAAIVGQWGGLSVLTTHLSRDAEARRLQTEAIASIGARLDRPALIMGDLNQSRRHLQALTVHGFNPVVTRRPFFRRVRPTSHVDHILVTEGIIVERSFTVSTEVSDHDVLVADIQTS